MEHRTQEERFRALVGWIEGRGGRIDGAIGAEETAEQGIGLVARREIAKNTTLFVLPRPGSAPSSPLLTVQTSALLPALSPAERRNASKNWVPLLLVLLWERVRALCNPDRSSSWAPYFDLLPREFDTLMFWNSDELRELTGSTILDKIGKEEAEADYATIVQPLIVSRPDIFPVPAGTSWEENYGLSMYHRMGSLILSRSFHVEPSADEPEPDQQDVSMDSAPSLVESLDRPDSQTQDRMDEDPLLDPSDEPDDDREAMEHIAMVPLADLLNAKSGSENAKLFYESDSLRMKTTKKINIGEQIYNTYGDPPNSDLLRRYGHMDDPNRFDVVEITIKTCLEVAHSHHSACALLGAVSFEELESRVEWALEMGLDDVFEIPTELERNSNGDPLLPEELTCILKILLLSNDDFQVHKSKQKLPKPKLNTADVIILSQRVIERRLKDYPTSIDEDRRLLEELRMDPDKSTTKRRKMNAIIVRKSEKEILTALQSLLAHKLSSKQNSTKQQS